MYFTTATSFPLSLSRTSFLAVPHFLQIKTVLLFFLHLSNQICLPWVLLQQIISTEKYIMRKVLPQYFFWNYTLGPIPFSIVQSEISVCSCLCHSHKRHHFVTVLIPITFFFLPEPLAQFQARKLSWARNALSVFPSLHSHGNHS